MNGRHGGRPGWKSTIRATIPSAPHKEGKDGAKAETTTAKNGAKYAKALAKKNRAGTETDVESSLDQGTNLQDRPVDNRSPSTRLRGIRCFGHDLHSSAPTPPRHLPEPKVERRKFPGERVELVVKGVARATMSGVIPTGVTHSGRKGFGKNARAMDACARRSSSSWPLRHGLNTHVNRSARCARTMA